MSGAETVLIGMYLLLLVALALYGAHRLQVAWLYWRHRHQHPHAPPLVDHPMVTVQLPVFNEPFVVERLIDAACQLEWPTERLEIQVLDDSTDATTALAEAAAARWRARGLAIHVLRRDSRTGFKAGALQHGMQHTHGDLLAIFDADFVPPPSFLADTVPHLLADPRVGMVQARWSHLNATTSLLTRLSAILLDGHFVLEHTARHRSGRFFNFNGTAGIWKRACIMEAGGWQHHTITEDLDLSYRAQLAGWRFVYLKEVLAPAELPATMDAFKTQQRRWALGTTQTARKLLLPILTSPLPLRIKLEATVHLTNNFAYPLVLLLAVLMPWSVMVRGHSAVATMLLIDLPAFVLASLSVALFYALSQQQAHPKDWPQRLWHVPLVMALGIGMSVSQTGAVIAGLFSNNTPFERTPKSGSTDATQRSLALPERFNSTAIVELLLAVYLGCGVVWAGLSGHMASIPFLAMFSAGFGYVGLTSLQPLVRSTPLVSPAPPQT